MSARYAEGGASPAGIEPPRHADSDRHEPVDVRYTPQRHFASKSPVPRLSPFERLIYGLCAVAATYLAIHVALFAGPWHGDFLRSLIGGALAWVLLCVTFVAAWAAARGGRP